MENAIEKETRIKKHAAMFSVISNLSLILLKFFAGFISGSISILSEAVHSASDLAASIIAFLSVSKSLKPADEDHPYGHGKYEYIASFIEGLLIILAALYIVFEASKKLVFHTSHHINIDLGLYVMAFSVITNFFVSSYLFNVAKQTSSPALHADAEHLRTDIWSSVAVIAGLIVVKVTGNPIFDPIIALIVACLIFHAGYKIFKSAEQNLMDTALDTDEIEKIKKIIMEFSDEGVISIKSLKTRRTGFKKNIEIILLVKGSMHISTSHTICDKIEALIDETIKHTDISIHLEPFD